MKSIKVICSAGSRHEGLFWGENREVLAGPFESQTGKHSRARRSVRKAASGISQSEKYKFHMISLTSRNERTK